MNLETKLTWIREVKSLCQNFVSNIMLILIFKKLETNLEYIRDGNILSI